MKRRFPLRMQLMMMVGIIIILLLSVLSFSLYELNQVTKGAERVVQHTANQAIEIKEGQLNFSEALKGLRGFLLYAAPNYEQESIRGLKKSLELAKDYNLKSSTQEQKIEGEKLEKLLINYVTFLDQIIAAKKANDPRINEMLSQGRQMTEEVDQRYAKLAEIQKKHLADQGKALLDSSNKMTMLATATSSIIVVLALLYGFWYSTNIARRLGNVRGVLEQVGQLNLTGKDAYPTRNDEIGDMALTIIEMRKALKEFVSKVGQTSDILGNSSTNLSTVVDEQMRAVESVADSATQIAAGAAHNVKNITNISATLQELSANSESAASSASEVSSGTNVAVQEAGRGMELLDSVVKQNEYIAGAMDDINTVTGNLANGSEKIKGIIGVISSISSQTNLLALNAAIEAARAGEAGRGFAVVAEEVRKLAEQSSQATKDIIDIISHMGEEINAAVSTVNKANQEVARGKEASAATKQGFDAIVNKLNTVNEGVENIADVVAEISQGSQEMVVNVTNINVVAEETSSNCEMVAASAEEQSARMHEISNSAESLAKMSNELKSMVRQFKI